MSDLLDLADAVDELTKPRENREPFSRIDDHGTLIRGHHKTHVPPLLEQLQEALEPGGTGDSGTRTVPGSRPSARLEAVDTYMWIEQAVYIWVKTYAEARRWDTLTDKLRALLGAATRIEPDELHELAREARRWVTAARVCTGWEVPAMTPANTCPLCGARGSLRIRVGDGINSASAHALCVGCRETWDDSNIGLLASHIRDENNDEPLYTDGAA